MNLVWCSWSQPDLYVTKEEQTSRFSFVYNTVHLSCIVTQTSLSYGKPADSKPFGCYQETLNHYERIGVIQNYGFYDEKIFYTSQVSVILPNSPHPIVGSSHVTFPQKHLAREEAAKDAVQQLECLLAPLQPQRGTVATVMVDVFI